MVGVCVGLLGAGAAPPSSEPESRPVEAPPDAVQSAVRELLGSGPPRGVPVWRRSAVWKDVGRFYERRDFRPAWSSEGTPTRSADHLLQSLCLAGARGLRSADYGLARIAQVYKQAQDEQGARLASTAATDPSRGAALAELDVRFTFAWLAYATDLLQGRTTRRWRHLPDEGLDVTELLEGALQKDGTGAALSRLGPDHAAYLRLLEALAFYRHIEASGGWKFIPKGPALEIGNRDARVPLVRARLDRTGDLLPAARVDGDVFDEALSESVRGFQRRHGLEPDGRLTKFTRWAMNVPAHDRIEQLEINLERWRWMPRELGERHLLVNIPAFELTAYEGGESVLRMRVITGQTKDWRTPRFAGEMKRVIFGPYWNVPRSIAVEEILPKVKRNPGWLAARNFQVLGRNGVVNPYHVDWSAITAENLPYRFRQLPGPGNSVGQVKFEFPNRYAVYLHDTPSQRLFERSQRTFSHGCVRVEQPADLADFLLDGDWPRERIDAALSTHEQQAVELEDPVPVYVTYFTAFVEEDGAVNFRRDVYEQDRYVGWKVRETRKWTDDAAGCEILEGEAPAET